MASMLAVSCTKRADFKYEHRTAYVRAKDIGVTEMRVITWKVGKYGKDVVSRGFRMSFDLPVLDDSAWKTLIEERDANGWLIRLRRKSGTRNERMGYLAVEMVSPKSGSKGVYRYNTSRKASVGVYYAASSVSTRLDRLPCPAFNHRYLIDEYGVESNNLGERLWASSSADSQRVSAKVEMISYSPITINGGMELSGDYHIDLALYNTKTKQRLSSYLEISHFARVEKEKSVSVKGCEGFTVPPKRKEGPRDKFKFGR